MQPIQPIFTADLFSGLHGELMQLLAGLDRAAWQRETVCKEWTVHDVAAHILDTQIRLITLGADPLASPRPVSPIANYSDLLALLNGMNAQWVDAARRIGPGLMIEFLAITGPLLAEHVQTLDPYAPAIFAVAWAGEEVSANWFDIGRSYTEYWHHQQQIRDATGAPPLTARKWLHPVLAIFVRALPHTFREIPGEENAAFTLTITEDAGGVWSLVRQHGQWNLFDGGGAAPLAAVTLSADAAWRLFTKGLSPDQARLQAKVEGRPDLIDVFFRTLSVMA